MTTPLARRTALQLGFAALGAAALTACADDGAAPGAARTSEPDGIELVSSDVRRAAGDPSLVAPVVAGLDRFAGELYGQLAAADGTHGNLVLSPYSVLVALGMTLTGAAGTTAEEMRTVLGVGDLGDRWHKGVNALTTLVEDLAGKQERADGSTAELALSTADQLFGQRDVAWEADFLDLLAKEYGAGLRTVDFERATEQARTAINGWVEDRTHDRIVDLVPGGVLDPSTRLVLVNAIYLKAPWEQPFEKGLTAPGAFHRLDGSQVDADLMRVPDLATGLASGDGWRSVVLPYAGRRLAMTVVLPDDGALDRVERQVRSGGFAVFTADAQPTVVDLSLPRWSFRTAAPLKDPLSALGMPTAFSDTADFTPMTEEDLPLVVAEVLHQGFVAVDEEGTEAAAATAVVMAETAAPVAVPFVVDRPFLFLIHDVAHAAPLFVGRVSDPTSPVE
ncbi:serpin family protein [Nocardioides daeguensis]|uniref:Serpin family protein n=1 Tax=Nocardioides daeguensis TaxID=908359 RepID=A0ABP6W9F3_9ACTN|nr:serpin family protein [Nocardioides daeguensis]MBV6729333.1 serpin family protein [Nocardioides daeguensis]MCR1774309.1 serpin family protein [Nocardioides daeguensis]